MTTGTREEKLTEKGSFRHVPVARAEGRALRDSGAAGVGPPLFMN